MIVSPSTYAQLTMADFPTRTRGIRAVIRALKAAGDPVVSVDDGDLDTLAVTREADILDAVHQVDEAHLITRSGARVYLVLCNGDHVGDTIADWSMSVDAIVSPVIDRYDD